MKNRPPSEREIGLVWGVARKTVENWRALGLDVFNADAIGQHIEADKSRLPGAVQKLRNFEALQDSLDSLQSGEETHQMEATKLFDALYEARRQCDVFLENTKPKGYEKAREMLGTADAIKAAGAALGIEVFDHEEMNRKLSRSFAETEA